MTDTAEAETTLELTISEDPPEAAAWPTTSSPPVELARFGKDHWSTFAYLECRVVDHKGMLDHRHLRCHGGRHPFFLDAAGPGKSCGGNAGYGGGDGRQYATRLKGERRDDGHFAGEELFEHDDYDCIDDLVAAGLVEVEMPTADAVHDHFVDARGETVSVDGEVIRPSFLSGMQEQLLARSARFVLTDAGWTVASQLRAYKAGGGRFHDFVPDLTEAGLGTTPTKA